ncbi:MAG: hypothetical protein ABI905_06525 [Betaproteobacteria bacterium]
MQNTGKDAPVSIKPSPNPGAIPNESDRMHEAVEGEGSYSGTRDYQKGVKEYLERADVEQDARDAAPHDAKEAKELDEAEKAARKGETAVGGKSEKSKNDK